MSKLTAFTHVTLDGFLARQNGELARATLNDQISDDAESLFPVESVRPSVGNLEAGCSTVPAVTSLAPAHLSAEHRQVRS